MAIKIMIEDIPIEVKRKPIKNMYLYVKAPNGTVVASVPMQATTTDINRFVAPRIDWIRRHREKFQNREIVKEKKFEEGDTVYIAGEPHTIRIIHAPTQYAEASDGILTLAMRNGHSPESRERVLREFLRGELYRRIDDRLPIFTDLTGLKPTELQIKNMDTRWGSCNTATGKIWINLKLAHMPDSYLDYILLHEIAHLAIHGHGADFSAFLDRYMMDWREIKKSLNQRYGEFI